MKMDKTNAMRILDAKGIAYTPHEYSADLTDGKEVAEALSKSLNAEVVQVIGTIVILYKKSTRKDFKHIELP